MNIRKWLSSTRNNTYTQHLGFFKLSILLFGFAFNLGHAATINVTSSLDDNGSGCTLREAMESVRLAAFNFGCEAPANFPSLPFGLGDTIQFDSSIEGSTIVLTRGQIQVLNGFNATIRGGSSSSNRITIDGNRQTRIFRILGGTLFLNQVNLTRGRASSSGGAVSIGLNSRLSINNGDITDSVSEGRGGAINMISSNSVLTLFNSSISGNVGSDVGGGISLENGASATITSSTIAHNTLNGLSGAGVGVDQGASATLINSTVSGNSMLGSGVGGIVNRGELTLLHVTVAENQGAFELQALASSVTTVTNSIITNLNNVSTCSVSSTALFTAGVDNVIRGGGCGDAAAFIGGILPLADNGGTTLTHALSFISSARGRANLSECTSRDQIGEIRNSGDDRCDAGAVEYLESDAPDDNNSNDGDSEASGGDFFVIPLRDGNSVIITL